MKTSALLSASFARQQQTTTISAPSAPDNNLTSIIIILYLYTIMRDQMKLEQDLKEVEQL